MLNSSFVDIHFKVVVLKKIFNLLLQLKIVFNVVAMVSVESIEFAFLSREDEGFNGLGRINRICLCQGRMRASMARPSQILLAFYFYKNFNSGE